MVDPERNLVIVYLTNKINTPITDRDEDPNSFADNRYTTSTLGFDPEILSVGMDSTVSDQLIDLAADMATESLKLVPEGVSLSSDHPSVRNFESKRALFEKMAARSADTAHTLALRETIEAAWQARQAAHGA